MERADDGSFSIVLAMGEGEGDADDDGSNEEKLIDEFGEIGERKVILVCPDEDLDDSHETRGETGERTVGFRPLFSSM